MEFVPYIVQYPNENLTSDKEARTYPNHKLASIRERRLGILGHSLGPVAQLSCHRLKFKP